MSDPIKHHYVPEVYLKSFADSQKQFFQLRREFNKIAVKTTAQVCYEKNYFKIQRDDTLFLSKIKDAYHIEKKVFSEQENNYAGLLTQLVFPSLQAFSMPRSSIVAFLKTLINIKRRNPSVRKILTDSMQQYLNSDKFREDAAPGIEISRRIDKIDPGEYLKNYLKMINTDGSRLSDGYLTRFLEEGQRLQDTIITILMKYKLFIYHSPIGHQFITSDNPGFVLNGDSVINFGGLGGEFAYMFPLSPQCLLVIDKEQSDNSMLLDKRIHPIYVDSDTVHKLNECTLKIANDKIFSFSRAVLVDIE